MKERGRRSEKGPSEKGFDCEELYCKERNM